MRMAADLSAAASPSPSPHEDDASDHQHHADDETAGGGGGQDSSSSSMESILLDIAFLHSIATHRPIGLHKHFNVIPILVNLERTARQVGARLRDDSYMQRVGSAEAESIKGGGVGVEARSIKQEDEMHNSAGGEASMASSASALTASAAIDSKYVWEKLNDLYDVEGLEELENQAIDNDDQSPFRQAAPTDGGDQSKAVFGFGSGLEKKKKPGKGSSNGRQAASGSNSNNSSSSKRGPANNSSEEAEIREMLENGGEFSLGPWQEFEEIIAPRRLKSYAPEEEEEPSESDEELSEPSDAEAATATGYGAAEDDKEDGEEGEEEEEEEEDGTAAASEQDEEEAEGESNVEEEEAEEEGEEDEEKVEEEQEATSKRKSSKKASNTNAKRARNSSATASRGSTRNAAKPRRSNRR